MAGSESCIHPIYIYLTGATRLREGWFTRRAIVLKAIR